MTNAYVRDGRDHGFLTGLIAGGVIGAGLVMYFAPRAATELRTRVAGSARTIGEAAAERFQRARTGVGHAIDDLARKGRNVRDELGDTVAQGAREVERYAMQASAGRVAGTEGERPATGR